MNRSCSPSRSPLAQAHSRLVSMDADKLRQLVSTFAEISIFDSPRAPRLFPGSFVFLLFLWQMLSCQSSCAQALIRGVGLLKATGVTLEKLSASTSAYCQARARMVDLALIAVSRQIVAAVSRLTTPSSLWHGHEVKVVDGTTILLEDTAANRERFPQPRTQKPGLGFPQVRIVALFSMVSGVILDTAMGAYLTSERTLFRRLWRSITSGNLIVGDCGFLSFWEACEISVRGAFFVLHSTKSLKVGAGLDVLEGWGNVSIKDSYCLWNRTEKPPRRINSKRWRKSFPDSLRVRRIVIRCECTGRRTRREICVITNLLDKVKYPPEEIALLYLRRWDVELWLRDIKKTMGLRQLRARSPKMARKQLLVAMVAYNLTRGLMALAQQEAQSQEPISFKAALGWIDAIGDAAPAGKRARKQWFAAFLLDLAARILVKRPHRIEPRNKKDRGTKFPFLKKPREQYREDIRQERLAEVS